ncbi:putative glycosyltransferase EpsJ [Anaerohalosphaera lusitana]|uniref:Putative glycosyltransferase EpsJ n=1 Tax=Anaerohalosphaera lusitana TaxID=1936003 RepID=A0A1U9NP56_9BACT|nr:glycosyltransferase family A protein [Anaerohalosphaera lusitana]AQT69625.1 putative glycosyltransferase EpsJ [Anaerohalosphaera lusitana]
MTKPSSKPVSVILPAYNAAEHIQTAVSSVLAQTAPPQEIIVIDDGSTDNTAEIVKSFGEKVRYIHQPNAGVSAARNTGIKAASAEWIAFLDADDEWLPEKLEKQFALLDADQSLAFCSANYIRISHDRTRSAPDVDPEKCRTLTSSDNRFDSYYTAFANGITGHTDTMLIRKTILEQVGMFNESISRFEDLDLWFRIAAVTENFGFISEPLAIYTVENPESLSRSTCPIETYADFIRRNLAFAKQHDKLDQFTPCAAKLLRQWIRSMLFDARKNDIRLLLDEFHNLLPNAYIRNMKIMTACPNTTANLCRLASRIIRTFNLRSRVVAKPTPKQSRH